MFFFILFKDWFVCFVNILFNFDLICRIFLVLILIFVVWLWVFFIGWWIIIFELGKVSFLFLVLVVNKNEFIEVVKFKYIVMIFVLMYCIVLYIVNFVVIELLGEFI